MRTPTLNHYFEPKIVRIIIEIIRYGLISHPTYNRSFWGQKLYPQTFVPDAMLPVYQVFTIPRFAAVGSMSQFNASSHQHNTS